MYNNKNFYLFRHGDTYETKNHLDYGKKIFTSPIIPEAEIYLKKIGEFLKDKKIDYLACSDLARCVQTAEIISQIINIPVNSDKRLTEYDPDNSFITENFESFFSRMSDFLDTVGNSGHENIAVCGHGSGIAALKNLIITDSFTTDRLRDYPRPGVVWLISKGIFSEIEFK